MSFFADLHVHSKYSRATSSDMSLESLWRWAQLKGINVVGTSDFTHPEWFKELKEKLDDIGNNLFKLKKICEKNNVPSLCRSEVYFMLTTEVSTIYTKRGRTRKIHSLIFAPDFYTVIRINNVFSRIGNLSADGRPILGLDAKELLKIILDISADAMFIPAHAWTPHFSVFGSESGFDSLSECFEDLTHHIYAIETGLSSDPPMNWRLSSLDRVALVSNSDAHSPSRLGREATIFDTEISYRAMMDALKRRNGLIGTIEFFPQEGKYHYDGHRSCGVSLSPKETMRYNYRCPVCGNRVTVGVMHRVEKLADRDDGYRPEGAPLYHSLIPLTEIISETLKVGVSSKAVETEYSKLLTKLGNEFKILMESPLSDIESAGSSILSEAISRMRSGNIQIEPGFDGKYGAVKIFEDDQKDVTGQGSLF